ncbi:MAG: EF-hand domain-containing protein [Planctomycetota bacterium]|jgi:hypothetical protein
MTDRPQRIVFKVPFLMLLALVAAATSVHRVACAQEDDNKDARHFDKNGDGYIDLKEAGAAIEHLVRRTERALSDLDRNQDGRITQEELDAYEKMIAAEVEDMRADYEDYVRAGLPANPIVRLLLVDEFNRNYFEIETPTDEKKTALPSNLLIRRTYDEQAIVEAAPFSRARGALFSYTRDLAENKDNWEVRGAIMYPIQIGKDDWSDTSGLAALRIMPSVSFDRVMSGIGSSAEVDSLVPRFGLEATLKRTPFRLQYLRANLAYATDFDLESGQVVGEFEWEPVEPHWGFGASQPFPVLGKVLEYRLRASLHLETGSVLSSGGRPGLVKDDTFVRVGPKLQLELFPTAPELDSLSFLVKYENFDTVSGDSKSTELFEAGLSYQLDDSGHLTIELAYRNGDIPLTADDTETFTVGLGVKF